MPEGSMQFPDRDGALRMLGSPDPTPRREARLGVEAQEAPRPLGTDQATLHPGFQDSSHCYSYE